MLLVHIKYDLRAQSIEATLLGQAYWTSDHSGNATFTGLPQWNDVKNSGVRLVRVGGIAYNAVNTGTSAKPTNALYYVTMVDEIRKNGCEPVITLPFVCPMNPTAAQVSAAIPVAVANAREIVRILNVVHKRNVKYFVLGNEPGTEYNFTTTSSANFVAQYVLALSKAAKDVDPEIKTIAPEYEWYNKPIYDILFAGSGASDISGLISSTGLANNKPIVDFMSVHQYINDFQTLAPGETVPSGVPDLISRIEKIQKDPYYVPVKRYRGVLQDMRLKCQTLSASRTFGGIQQPLKFMITEANESHDNEATATGADNVGGMDTRSFVGGQLWARMLSLAMEYGCSSVMFWSVRESMTGNMQDRGYIAASTLLRPSYYHYKAISTWFRGEYLKDEMLNKILLNSNGSSNPNSNSIDPTCAAAYTSPSGTCQFFYDATGYDFTNIAFASKNENITVMVMNRAASPKTFSIRFDGTTVSSNFGGTSGTYQYSFAGGTGISSTYMQHDFTGTGINSPIGANSTIVFVFGCNGKLLERWTTSQSSPGDFQPYTPASGTPQTISTVFNNNGGCISTGNAGITITSPGDTYAWYKAPNNSPFESGLNVNSVTNLEQGAYITEISGNNMCGTTSTLNVIYKTSPLIDAGNDANLCATSYNNIPIGNSTLPTLSGTGAGYSWTSGTTGCSAPAFNTKSTLISCSAGSTQYIMTANDGACSISDPVNILLSGTPPTEDVFIQDSPVDVGDQPNSQTNAAWPGGVFWASEDIWTRNVQADKISFNPPRYSLENVHENPKSYFPNPQYPFIYAKFKNKSCVAVNGVVKLYFADASVGLTWPGQWTQIGAASGIPVTLNSGDVYVVEQAWINIPNPTSGGNHHFCLVARFESSSTGSGADVITGETSNIWTNAANYNNIAWKNVTVMGSDGSLNLVYVHNIVKETQVVHLHFVAQKDKTNHTILDYATINLHVTPMMMKRWVGGGKRGHGVVALNDTTIQVVDTNATMENIFLRYDESEQIAVQAKGFKLPPASSEQYFKWHLIQFNEKDKVQPDGGELYLIDKALMKARPCFTSTNVLNGSISGTQSFNNNPILITGNIIVPAGASLNLSNMDVMIAENVTIKVLAGGAITLSNAHLMSACPGKKWGGISVKSNPSVQYPITILKSNIEDATNPIFIEKAGNVLISGTSFIGDGLGTAIAMEKVKDFQISENTFNTYSIGISTLKTDVANVKSLIEKNIFENVLLGLQFNQDNHQKLDLKCNRFMYANYAVLSDNTTLKDQGNINEGAGNEFISTSTLPNNKLKHTNGNAAKYYYDPNQPITSGMNIAVFSSITDRSCYTYDFDTSATAFVSSRIASANHVLESINNKAIDVYSVPNPNSGQASIFFSLGAANQGEITIMDIFGKIVDHININSEAEKVEVNYTQFANGIYFLTVTNNKGEKKTQKMIINK